MWLKFLEHGVPAVALWFKDPTAVAWVPLEGWVCSRPGAKGQDSCIVTAVAWIPSLAREFPCAVGVAPPKKNSKKKEC